MQYLIGSTSRPAYDRLASAIDGLGMLLAPGRGWRTPFSTYACDNGVYGAWLRGEVWGERMDRAWLKMLAKIPTHDPPLWVLLPDAVANWPRTVELARQYLPLVRAKGLPIAIAIQDGCEFDEVLEMEPEWVFVAGSTQWKLENLARVSAFFGALDIGVHVGRVNTRRRLKACIAANIESVDGTTLNKFPTETLRRIRRTLLEAL